MVFPVVLQHKFLSTTSSNMLHAVDDVVNVGIRFSAPEATHYNGCSILLSVPALNLYRLYQWSSTLFAMRTISCFSRMLVGLCTNTVGL